MAWLVANTKAVVPLTAHAGGRLGMVGATRAVVYHAMPCPMRNYVYRLVTTSFRLINPLSLPGPKLTRSSRTIVGLEMGSVQTFCSLDLKHVPGRVQFGPS